ncbi:MAG: type II CRISPR RNA-guided endonuclease Cas9 [Candidatus Acidiferrales bacterium]
MSEPQQPRDYILGIDLGVGSVGWAALECKDGRTTALIRAGARVFTPAVEGNIEGGREESRNVARRSARLQRRQTWRRSRRNLRVFRLLQSWELLPSGPSKTPQERHDLFDQLDLHILSSGWFDRRRADKSIPEPMHVLPYLLRAAALDEPLEPHFLGRAIYHLAQRRGFLSNRKVSGRAKADDDSGLVKPAIAELRKHMADAGSRTIGEFFARISPSQTRIRTRWTARDMCANEFDSIWNSQTPHHPRLLTDERKKLLHKAIYFQRPLKSARNLIGSCELEPKHRRAPRSLLLSQKFRLLQRVNDLQVLPEGQATRNLTSEERFKLLISLEIHGDLTFPAIRKLLSFSRDTKFNLEAAGETRVPGNRTNAFFLKLFADRWDKMSSDERAQVVDYVRSFQRLDKLPAAAMKRWGLTQESAQLLEADPLESDYFNLSNAAMCKLVPLLETGLSYAEARRQLYPDRFLAQTPRQFLPPVFLAESAVGRIRNPSVVRSLTELRKVVNALIHEFGKPAQIRIELGRDLRNSRVQRERMAKSNRDNEKLRIEAARRILRDVGNPNPSRRDLQKAQLWDECHGECPYTGKPIPFASLFGPEPQFDIEHIIPFSRSLDNSFTNLTLCYAEHNRNTKQNRAPCEAYGSDPDTYQAILNRVRKFSSRSAPEKLRRFLMTPEEIQNFVSDFAESQLNDTRYASRLAADYLGLLYGGRVDHDHKLRIRSTAGRITAMLRDEWKLNAILNDGPTSHGGDTPKSRDDHRHHAIDAIVTALTDDGTIQILSRAAEKARLAQRRRFAPIEEPWQGFFAEVRDEISRIVVSHRTSGRVRGPLHEQTLYSHPIPVSATASGQKRSQKPAFEHRVRKPLEAMTVEEAANIADPTVRALVADKLSQFGDASPKTVFSVAANLPSFKITDGRTIPIKKARVRKPLTATSIGSGPSGRFVVAESNHHAEIFAELDERGKEVEWDVAVVSLAEAVERKRLRQPVVRVDHGGLRSFKFSVAPGDVIEMDVHDGKRQFFVVRGTSYPQIALAPISDARLKDRLMKDRVYLRLVPNSLKKKNARKVHVSPLGDVESVHD